MKLIVETTNEFHLGYVVRHTIAQQQQQKTLPFCFSDKAVDTLVLTLMDRDRGPDVSTISSVICVGVAKLFFQKNVTLCPFL